MECKVINYIVFICWFFVIFNKAIINALWDHRCRSYLYHAVFLLNKSNTLVDKIIFVFLMLNAHNEYSSQEVCDWWNPGSVSRGVIKIWPWRSPGVPNLIYLNVIWEKGFTVYDGSISNLERGKATFHVSVSN